MPSAVTSLLSLQNVKEFIENGLLTNEKLNIAKKPSSILVTRQDQKGNRSHFFVIDNPSKLKEPDWFVPSFIFIILSNKYKKK